VSDATARAPGTADARPAAAVPAEHHLSTLRTGRYFTIGADSAQARHVWFVLHGYAQLASRTLRHFNGIVPDDTMIVAPEALSRFYLELPRTNGGHMARVGASWLTREDRDVEIRDAVGWLDSVFRTVVDRITVESGVRPIVTVLAFSQGVATSMRWIANGTVQPSRWIAWAGSVASDVDPADLRAALADAELVFVAGTRDQFLAAEGAREAMIAQWSTLGLTPRQVTYDGTHELEPAVLASLLER
jgi:hypothetical protein